MNREIRHLLSEAGVSREVRWHEVIVLQNRTGRIFRHDVHNAPGQMGGFNFVIHDGGKPEYFVKCRRAGDAVLARETTIQSCLARKRSARVAVPEARAAEGERYAIQVSPFIEASPYGETAPKQSVDAYLSTVEAVLYGMAELVTFAQDSCHDVETLEATLDLHTSALESLNYVAEHGLVDNSSIEVLASRLASAPPIPSRPQHGDLWHQNILYGDGSLWVIDLEHYGTVNCPLYDDLTFLQSTIQLRRDGRVDGIGRLLDSHPEAVGWCVGPRSSRPGQGSYTDARTWMTFVISPNVSQGTVYWNSGVPRFNWDDVQDR